MNCTVCHTPFSKEEAHMIQRDRDTPICDSCVAESMEAHISYDGRKDLLGYLQEELPKDRICYACLSKTITLTGIRSDNPIVGYTLCKTCNREDELDIYLVDM